MPSRFSDGRAIRWTVGVVSCTGPARLAGRPANPRGGTMDAMETGIPVTGVSELVLEVVDLEAAERFYAEVLGLPVVERWPEREAIWVMAGDGTRIGLWRPQVGLHGGRGGIHVHFAMYIPDERYDAAVTHLRDQGQQVVEQD